MIEPDVNASADSVQLSLGFELSERVPVAESKTVRELIDVRDLAILNVKSS